MIMPETERLQRYLARCGVASRRACEEIIASGRVTVNGQPVTRLGTAVNPARDRVEVDGRSVSPEQRAVYLALNKPKGILTSASDRRGRRVVLDLLSGVEERVFPVGRLDMDSEGLLLLTNDGELAYRLTHPRYLVSKTYLVTVSGDLDLAEVEKLRKGVDLDDGITGPAEVARYKGRKLAVASDGTHRSQWLVTIHEGRKRQVRRMFDAIGHRVHRLVRIKFGPIELGELAPGGFRHLWPEEVQRLRGEVGLTS